MEGLREKKYVSFTCKTFYITASQWKLSVSGLTFLPAARSSLTHYEPPGPLLLIPACHSLAKQSVQCQGNVYFLHIASQLYTSISQPFPSYIQSCSHDSDLILYFLRKFIIYHLIIYRLKYEILIS